MSSEGCYVAVAGLIGVGKTTLARQLSAALKAELVMEEYDQNPFLSLALGGEDRGRLASEVFFLMSRVRQLRRDRFAGGGRLVSDYVFEKNGLFARLLLEERELAVYEQLESVAREQVAGPSHVVYLVDRPQRCLERIARRGRCMERGITEGWLGRLAGQYERLFEHWQGCPVLRIDCEQYDVRRAETVELICQRLFSPQPPLIEEIG